MVYKENKLFSHKQCKHYDAQLIFEKVSNTLTVPHRPVDIHKVILRFVTFEIR